MAADWIRGVMNLRGRLLPVVDLAVLATAKALRTGEGSALVEARLYQPAA